MSLPIYVFPLKGKTPYPGCRWRIESRPREEWESWPSDATGYGVDCAKSRLVVIDEDIPGAVAEWLGYDPQPLTYTVETGRGRHFWFEEPEGVTIKSSTGKHGSGVDIKTAGGYVVGPGSIHLETGVEYRALNEHPVVPIPSDILHKLGKKPTADDYDTRTDEEKDQQRQDQQRQDEDDTEFIDRLARIQWKMEAAKLESQAKAREYQAEKIAASAPQPDVALLSEVLLREEPPEDRIKGLMPWDASTTVIAQNKTGKTTLTGNLIRCLITGDDFLGRFEVRPIAEDARVCVLNYEMSDTTFASWASDMGIPGDRLVVVNLRGRTNPLASLATRKRFAEQLRPYNIESLIVDPFGRAIGRGNQNDPSVVQPWLNDLDTFGRELLGVLDIVLVVHAGWDAERSRGGSPLEDWPDAKWNLVKSKDDPKIRYFRASGRDVEVDEDQLHYDPETRRLTLTGNGGRSESADSGIRQRIVEFLKGNADGASGNALKNGVKGDPSAITRVRNEMVDDGSIVRTYRKGQGGGYIFTLAYQDTNQGGK